MAQRFSQETLEFLERAQAAIERSVELRCHTRQCLDDAQRQAFHLMLAMSEGRGQPLTNVGS